jgi:hypothetical protein
MKYVYTLLIFSLSFGAYAQETVIAVWDFTDNSITAEMDSSFSDVANTSLPTANFITAQTDQTGGDYDNSLTLTDNASGNGFTNAVFDNIGLNSTVAGGKLHLSVSLKNITMPNSSDFFQIFLKGAGNSNYGNNHRPMGMMLRKDSNGDIEVVYLVYNNGLQYGGTKVAGTLGASFSDSITLGITTDFTNDTSSFWVGSPGENSSTPFGLVTDSGVSHSTGWGTGTVAVKDALLIRQMQFKILLGEGSSVEMDQIKISTGDYENTLSSDNIINEQSFVRMYPNPADNYIMFNGIQDESKVDLFNITGQIVKSFDLVSSWDQVDISYIDKGVYFVSVNNGESTIKLIKK